MKNFRLYLAILAAAGSVRAEESSSAYTVTADFSYASDDVSRGMKQSDDSFQPSVEGAFHDCYVGIWNSEPLKRHEEDEIDFYGGYRYKLNESFSFEAVGTYYEYPEAKRAETRHSYEIGGGATYTVRGITLSLYGYRDFKLSATTEQASLGYSIPLKRIGASLDMTAYVGAVASANTLPYSGADSKQSYEYTGIDLSVPYKVSAKTTLVVGGHWMHNHGLPTTYQNDDIWWTAGVNVVF